VHARANHRPDLTLTADALDLLAAQPWPGNVRQLENFIERLVVLSDHASISAADVKRELGLETPIPREEAAARSRGPADLSLGAQRRHSEREALMAALQRSGNNRTLAARLLGISRRTLYTKLEEHGLV